MRRARTTEDLLTPVAVVLNPRRVLALPLHLHLRGLNTSSIRPLPDLLLSLRPPEVGLRVVVKGMVMVVRPGR